MANRRTHSLTAAVGGRFPDLPGPALLPEHPGVAHACVATGPAEAVPRTATHYGDHLLLNAESSMGLPLFPRGGRTPWQSTRKS